MAARPRDGGPPEPPGRLVVGRVVRAHGLRGEVSIEEITDVQGRFAPGARIGVGDPGDDPPTLTVAASRPGPKGLLVRFREVGGRPAAEALRGALLSVPAEDPPPLPPGRYFAHEIEGLEAVDEGGEPLGVVVRVEGSAASDLWVVRHRGRDVLVPAVSAFVRAVDLSARRVVIRPIPGLFD